MANRTDFVARGRQTVGDAAVDGLLAGMAAGVVMGVALVLMELPDDVGQLQTLGRFDPAGGSAVAGGLLHLAVSGIYGVIFAVGNRWLTGWWARARNYEWAIGTGFGLAIWLAAQFTFLPGLDSALAATPPHSFAVAHLVYGGMLGYLIGRQQLN